MNIKNNLVKALDETFLPHGFKKERNNWIYYGELILRINLQKSIYGKIFYFNIDIYPNGSDESILKDTSLYFTTRLELFLSSKEIEKQYNFEGLLDNEIQGKILEISNNIGNNISVLINRTNIDIFRNYLSENKGYLLGKDFTKLFIK